jgi:hypothetical protein
MSVRATRSPRADVRAHRGSLRPPPERLTRVAADARTRDRIVSHDSSAHWKNASLADAAR